MTDTIGISFKMTQDTTSMLVTSMLVAPMLVTSMLVAPMLVISILETKYNDENRSFWLDVGSVLCW